MLALKPTELAVAATVPVVSCGKPFALKKLPIISNPTTANIPLTADVAVTLVSLITPNPAPHPPPFTVGILPSIKKTLNPLLLTG